MALFSVSMQQAAVDSMVPVRYALRTLRPGGRTMNNARFVSGKRLAGCCLAWALAVSGPLLAGSVENDVRARWRGAWIVVSTEIYSDCDGSYQTNKISGQLVTSGGRHRYAEGLHGGRSTGPPKGNRNALRHGFYSADRIEERRRARATLAEFRQLMDEF